MIMENMDYVEITEILTVADFDCIGGIIPVASEDRHYRRAS